MKMETMYRKTITLTQSGVRLKMNQNSGKTNKKGVKHLIDGGLHYGHLQMDFKQTSYSAELTLTPVYIFPILNDRYDLVRTERRVYDDVQKIHFNQQGNVIEK